MSCIFDLMTRCVDLARCNFMQQRFPEVSWIPVDQNHVGEAVLADAIAEPRGEFESGRAASPQ